MKMAAREQRETSSEDESSPDLRRGPWTVEEDLLLVNYIAAHGEGRWNALARCAGLKRTGKSCRLRWLNYLRPDLRRGNMTAQEQLLILELHSRWGNRWSKIAQQLPGRTDNEIKNYWRTRVQKHARQMGCDVNSQQFKDLMRYLWMPRLLERIHSNDDVELSSKIAQQQQLNNDVELSSCITAASIDDGIQHQHLSPAPAMVSAAAAGNDAYSYWSSCTDNNNKAADTWCQPPHTLANNNPVYLGGAGESETCSWSEVPAGGLFSSGVFVADMMPDLGGETMCWGGADNDLWYTQIMGL